MEIKKLHLGCGVKHIDGFFHVDVKDFAHVDRAGPVEDLSFIEADTVELIYVSHVLEHFGRHEYRDVLAEWFRVLEPGGVLRLGVPDFEAAARLYLDKDSGVGLLEILGLLIGGQRDEYDHHTMVYDEVTLSATLRDVGFSEVRRWDWRATDHAHIDDYSQAYLPHMDKVKGKLVSLNIEAVK